MGPDAPRQPAFERAAVSLPAAAVLILGLTYAVGAFARAVELHQADVPVFEVFPLIPIEQHLGRGIEILFSPDALGFYLAILLTMVMTVFLFTPEQTTAARPRKKRWLSRQTPATRRRIESLLAVGILLVGIVVAPFLVVLALANVILIAALLLATVKSISQPTLLDAGESRSWWVDRLRNRRATPRDVVAIVLIVMASTALSEALVDPRPVSIVELEKRSGQRVSGKLIVIADQTWYVGLEGDARPFTAVPMSTVRSSRVDEASDDGESLYESLPSLLR